VALAAPTDAAAAMGFAVKRAAPMGAISGRTAPATF